jgi:hypothetical protein
MSLLLSTELDTLCRPYDVAASILELSETDWSMWAACLLRLTGWPLIKKRVIRAVRMKLRPIWLPGASQLFTRANQA